MKEQEDGDIGPPSAVVVCVDDAREPGVVVTTREVNGLEEHGRERTGITRSTVRVGKKSRTGKPGVRQQ